MWLIAALAAGLTPRPTDAQVGVQLGVVGSSKLVRDSIVEPFTVRPNLALALGASAETRVDRYRLGLAVVVTRSDLATHSATGTTPITRLTVWHPSLYLRHEVAPWLSGEVHLGLIVYDPADRSATIFRDGAPHEPSLGLGLRGERRLGRRVALGVGVRYDVHRFGTTALTAQGFSGQTLVHRIGALITVRRVATPDVTASPRR